MNGAKSLACDLEAISLLLVPFDCVAFGATLQLFREAVGISQSKLAVAANVNERTIRRIEAGLPSTTRTVRSVVTTALVLSEVTVCTDEQVWELFRKRYPDICRSFTDVARLVMEKPESSLTA